MYIYTYVCAFRYPQCVLIVFKLFFENVNTFKLNYFIVKRLKLFILLCLNANFYDCRSYRNKSTSDKI